MPDLGAPELIIIAAVVLVLFGSKKLPGAAKSLGQSMRIFRSEVKGMKEDDPAPPPATETRRLVAAEQPVPQPVLAPEVTRVTEVTEVTEVAQPEHMHSDHTHTDHTHTELR